MFSCQGYIALGIDSFGVADDKIDRADCRGIGSNTAITNRAAAAHAAGRVSIGDQIAAGINVTRHTHYTAGSGKSHILHVGRIRPCRARSEVAEAATG